MIKPVNKYKSNKKARAIWQDLRELAKTTPSPFKKMTEKQVLARLRKTREKLWDEKISACSRHK